MKKAERKQTEPFCLIFKVKPESLADQEIKVGNKVALVFALFDSENEAKKQAVKLLGREHWRILAMKMVSPLLPFQIIHLNTLQKECYKKAAKERIAYCILDNWPIFYRPEDYK